jgi:hypothetical protein
MNGDVERSWARVGEFSIPHTSFFISLLLTVHTKKKTEQQTSKQAKSLSRFHFVCISILVE